MNSIQVKRVIEIYTKVKNSVYKIVEKKRLPRMNPAKLVESVRKSKTLEPHKGQNIDIIV